MTDGVVSREFRSLYNTLRRAREEKLKKLTDDALRKALLIAGILKGRYGVRKVYLYGSLAWGGFREGSDIDIFIEGFEGQYWRMYADMQRLASPFDVSIVLAEDASQSLRDTVAKSGVIL